MSHLAVLFLALVWLTTALSAGRTLLRLFAIPSRGHLEPLLLSLALGFPFVSYLVFFLGTLGWLTSAMIWTVFALLLTVGYSSWWCLNPLDFSRWLYARWSEIFGLHSGRWIVLGCIVLILLTAGLNLVSALAPPTEWDSLAYHLALPDHYVRQGYIYLVPYYKDWGSPFTAEMWNIVGLLLGSESLPQVFQWTMGIASATALYLLAACRTSRKAGLLTATVYYLSPHIIRLSSSAKSDLAWLTFLFLSFHLLLTWREEGERRWLYLSAVFTGLTLGTKLYGLFWAPSIGLVLVLLQCFNTHAAVRQRMFQTLLYAAIAALFVLPWWLRNWIAAGDPIWPYGYSFFHSNFWTQELSDKYAAWSQGPGDSVWHYITGLWNLTVNQAAWPFGLLVPISPVALAFLPGLALIPSSITSDRRRCFGLILAATSVYYTLWFCTYQQPRYFVPVLALLLVPACYTFWQISQLQWSGWAARGLLSLSFLMFFGYTTLFTAQFVPVVIGLESRESFLARKVSFYEDTQWLNRNIPSDARILSLHPKTFYLRRDFMLGYSNIWRVQEETSAGEYLQLLRQQNITHIFLTEIWQRDREYHHMNQLLDQLRAQGQVLSVYKNSDAALVESRTLARSRRTTVEVLEVVPF